MKDPYIFDLMGQTERMTERDIERQLVSHVTKYLLDMGNGFAFVAQQKHFQVGNQDFYADLVLYNITLHAYVVVELEQLFLVCWRHLWCTLGHRRHCGLLYGKHLCGRNVLWMEKGFAWFPPRFNMAYGYRSHHFGLVDISGQRLDAISRGLRVQPRHHAQRDGEFHRRCPVALRNR